MMLPVVVRCIVETIPHTMKKELLRALDAALQEHTKAPDVLKRTGWPRSEIHSGYWNLVPQSATDERCARYVGLPENDPVQTRHIRSKSVRNRRFVHNDVRSSGAVDRLRSGPQASGLRSSYKPCAEVRIFDARLCFRGPYRSCR